MATKLQAGGRGRKGGGSRGSIKELQPQAPQTLADLGLDKKTSMLKETKRNTGAKGVRPITGSKREPLMDTTPTLADLGLDKKTSMLAASWASCRWTTAWSLSIVPAFVVVPLARVPTTAAPAAGGGPVLESPRLGIHLRRCAVEGRAGLDNLSAPIRRPIRGTRRVEHESARLSPRG